MNAGINHKTERTKHTNEELETSSQFSLHIFIGRELTISVLNPYRSLKAQSILLKSQNKNY